MLALAGMLRPSEFASLAAEAVGPAPQGPRSFLSSLFGFFFFGLAFILFLARKGLTLGEKFVEIEVLQDFLRLHLA